MSSEAYEQIAIDALVYAFGAAVTGFAAQLRIVETEDSLPANSLTNPEDIVGAFVPMDPRSPLIQIYDEATKPTAHREKLADCDATILISYNGDADVVASELRMRRYLRAARMVLTADPRCGNRVGQVYWTDSNRADLFYESTTRMGRALGVSVRIQDA